MMDKQLNRSLYIDLLRVLGVVAVVLIHIDSPLMNMNWGRNQGYWWIGNVVMSLLKAAYWQDYSPVFTDDASVVEHYWMSECMTDREIVLVEGNRENIKITTTFDLLVAEMLLSV